MTQPTLSIDREKRQIIMTRLFEAPRELVFKTYIDPKLIRGMATLRAKLGHSLNVTFSDRIPLPRSAQAEATVRQKHLRRRCKLQDRNGSWPLLVMLSQ
jgi:hypothetical protein